MNYMDKYVENGYYVKINVNNKPFADYVVCVMDDNKYKFKIDELNKLNDGTYEIISKTLLNIKNI